MREGGSGGSAYRLNYSTVPGVSLQALRWTNEFSLSSVSNVSSSRPTQEELQEVMVRNESSK